MFLTDIRKLLTQHPEPSSIESYKHRTSSQCVKQLPVITPSLHIQHAVDPAQHQTQQTQNVYNLRFVVNLYSKFSRIFSIIANLICTLKYVSCSVGLYKNIKNYVICIPMTLYRCAQCFEYLLLFSEVTTYDIKISRAPLGVSNNLKFRSNRLRLGSINKRPHSRQLADMLFRLSCVSFQICRWQ